MQTRLHASQPFFRSMTEFGDPGAGGGESDDDREDASPGDLESDDEDRDRPGGYPESDDLDEDLDEDAVDETEDLGGDEDEEDLDRSPERSWESVAKEERRRRLRLEKRQDEIVARLLGSAGPPQPPSEEKEEEPPYTDEQLLSLMKEGAPEEYFAAQRKMDAYRERKLRKELSIEAERQADARRLESRVRQKLDFTGESEFARAAREKLREIQEDFPGLPQFQAALLAAAEVGAEAHRKGRKTDLRSESNRRRRRQLPESRTKDRRAKGVDSTDPAKRLNSRQRRMLERAGLYEEYTTPQSDPKAERERRRKLRRLLDRVAEVNEGKINV